MKNIKLKLGFLSNMSALSHTASVPVLLNNDPDKLIGTCEIKRENGEHVGYFTFDDETNENLYVYYMSENSYDRLKPYHLSHFNLSEKDRNDIQISAGTLRQMAM